MDSIWVLLAHFALTSCVALRVIYARHSSSAALAWLMLLFALPLAGVLLYLLIGEPRLGRRRAKRRAEVLAFLGEFSKRFLPAREEIHERRFQLLANLVEQETGYGVLSHNQTELLTGADGILERLIEDIHKARYNCLLQFYIVDVAGRIEEVMQALMKAAERGVDCLLLADDLGSKRFWKSSWPKRLEKAGVRVTRALPVRFLSYLWVRSDLRNHRKIVVIDYEVAYTGSYNLVDPRFFKQNAGVGEWIDAMVRCQGMVARQLAGVFYSDWAVENEANLKETLNRFEAYLAMGDSEREALLATPEGDAFLQVLPSQPDMESALVYEALMSAIYIAREEIVMCSPYFVPDEPLLNALLNAAKRGVRVVLIMPKNNDSRLVHYASRAYYQALLSAGVEIKVFTQGLLHTKAILIDERFAFFGTVNIDMRSFYLNLEVCLLVFSAQEKIGRTIYDIQMLLQGYLQDCEPVILSRWQKRSGLQRFIERCVRLISPLL